jgi:hypothetical protein
MYQYWEELKAGAIDPKDSKVRQEMAKKLKKKAQTEKLWYVLLPLKMQKIEADFMFNRIIPQIGKRTFLPVHDSILVEKTDRKNVKDIRKLFMQEFKKLGVIVRITEEEW